MTPVHYTLETAQEALASQPFGRLIGTRLTTFSGSDVELTIDIVESHYQQHGFVHGGVISYAADNAIAFAATTKLGKGVVTTGLNVHFLRPARGALLIARATVIHATGRQAVCRCEVHTASAGDQGDHVATATGTVVSLSRAVPPAGG